MRKECEEGATSLRPVKTRRTSSVCGKKLKQTESRCFFCNGVAGTNGLHKASTFDTDLLAKLAGGDMVAIEAEYHGKCSVAFYNKVLKLENTLPNDNGNETSLHGITFASLVAYIEECREDSESAPVFKLADVTKLYFEKLNEHGIRSSPIKINSTRLEEKLLLVFPDLGAHAQGRDVLLSFNHAIGDAIRKAYEQDFYSEALHLARAAKIVRRGLFKMPSIFN